MSPSEWEYHINLLRRVPNAREQSWPQRRWCTRDDGSRVATTMPATFMSRSETGPVAEPTHSLLINSRVVHLRIKSPSRNMVSVDLYHVRARSWILNSTCRCHFAISNFLCAECDGEWQLILISSRRRKKISKFIHSRTRTREKYS